MPVRLGIETNGRLKRPMQWLGWQMPIGCRNLDLVCQLLVLVRSDYLTQTGPQLAVASQWPGHMIFGGFPIQLGRWSPPMRF